MTWPERSVSSTCKCIQGGQPGITMPSLRRGKGKETKMNQTTVSILSLIKLLANEMIIQLFNRECRPKSE
jgi:hypothetical protein